ncbi:MAG: hypothetical protein ABR564_06425, partial [Candidatus Dormibacteria bacterium]
MTGGGEPALYSESADEARTSVLVLTTDSRDGMDAAVLAALSRFPSLVVREHAGPDDLGHHDALLALSASRPLGRDEADELERFLRRGGAMVILGRASDVWAAGGRKDDRLGLPAWTSRAPRTDLRIRPVPGNLTTRLDPTFIVRDSLRIDLAVPDDGVVLL